MGSLIWGVIELIFGIVCAFQQMATTHDSVVSALQGGTFITSHMSAQDVLTVLNQNADKFNRIGWFVAISTQVMFVSSIMPGSPIKDHGVRTALLWLFSIFEITTDIWYSIATATTLGGVFTFIFTLGWTGIGASLFYVIAMAAGSVFVFVDGLHRTEHALGKLRGKPTVVNAR
ncbi:MAG: hypothetical protein AUF65_01395 [Chloroflexi bacterium 13_1_20CM_50_12]|nr:MAG: hypothetical protein AUF65_01395 [Chloroflexi bacterium 13_1_20CM_50_12]